MKINGKLNVDDFIQDSPFEIGTSVDDLKLKLTKIGSIGYYDEKLYFRKNATDVVPLISIIDLTQALSNLTFNTTVINNIAEDLINNQDFINNVINSINYAANLINNQDFIDAISSIILENLNIEVMDLGGNTLFFAFNPNTITSLLKKPNLPDSTNCVTPTSIEFVGNMKPKKGETLEYTVIQTGSTTGVIAFSVTGGTFLTSPNEDTVQVSWDTDYNGLASLNVAVGCLSDTQNTKYLWNFFTLDEN